MTQLELLLSSAEYGPGHPWYYLAGGAPIPASDIRPGRHYDEAWYRGRLSGRKLAAEIERAERELAEATAHYTALCEGRTRAVSSHDRRLFGDDELAIAQSLALRHNHIAWHKGEIEFFRRRNETALRRQVQHGCFAGAGVVPLPVNGSITNPPPSSFTAK